MAILIWAFLGAALGAVLTPLARRFVTQEDGRSPSILIGLVTAIAFGILAWRVSSWADLLGYSVFAAFGIAVSVIDMAEHRVPTRLVLPAYPVLVGLFVTMAFLQRDLGGVGRATIGMLVLPAFYLTLALVSRGGVGAGDIRLAGPVGWVMAWHGWTTLVVGTLLAFVFASLAGLTTIAWRSGTRNTRVPFAPAMVTGALAIIALRGA